MSKYTNEELFKRYQGLPKDVQDAILSVDTAEIIKEIGEKHKLMIDKTGEMADETGLVMLGFTHPSQYVSNLADRLEIEREVAKEIAEEINSKVFFPIRKNLKKIHGVEPEEEGLPKDSPLEIPKVGPTEPSEPTAQPTAPVEPLITPPAPIPETPPPPAPPFSPIAESIPETSIPETPKIEETAPATKPDFAATVPPETPPAETPAKPIEVQKIDPYREPV